MAAKTYFITGTDTGVGKTVLTTLLAQHLRYAGIRVAALKPVCSGGRDDAHALQMALPGVLTLDEINPWHFDAPIAPVLAARMVRKEIRLADAVSYIDTVRRRFEITLVEGAGGLLSPLGEDFDCRDLLTALRASPIVVCPDRVGAVNQVRLVWEALSAGQQKQARVALIEQSDEKDHETGNSDLLGEFVPQLQIVPFPQAGAAFQVVRRPSVTCLTTAIERLVG